MADKKEQSKPAEKKMALNFSFQSMATKIGVLILFFLLIILFVSFIYIPKQAELDLKERKMDQIADLTTRVDTLKVELAAAQKQLLLAQTKYKKNTVRAYTQTSLDRLLGNISYLGNEYGLSINKLEQLNRSDVAERNDKNLPKLTEVHINFQLSGRYLDYMQFRQSLLGVSRAVYLPSETIKVLKTSSKIEVAGELIVYLADELEEQ